jgi:hypothetical protein
MDGFGEGGLGLVGIVADVHGGFGIWLVELTVGLEPWGGMPSGAEIELYQTSGILVILAVHAGAPLAWKSEKG